MPGSDTYSYSDAHYKVIGYKVTRCTGEETAAYDPDENSLIGMAMPMSGEGSGPPTPNGAK